MSGYSANVREFPNLRSASAARRRLSAEYGTINTISSVTAWHSRLEARQWRDARATVLAMAILAGVAGAALIGVGTLIVTLCVGAASIF